MKITVIEKYLRFETGFGGFSAADGNHNNKTVLLTEAVITLRGLLFFPNGRFFIHTHIFESNCSLLLKQISKNRLKKQLFGIILLSFTYFLLVRLHQPALKHPTQLHVDTYPVLTQMFKMSSCTVE